MSGTGYTLLAAAVQRRKKGMEEGDDAVESTTTCISVIILSRYLGMLDPQRTAMPESWQLVVESLDEDWNWAKADTAIPELVDKWGGTFRRD